MVSAGTGALRLTRALGLALAAYGLSLVAHVAGGGQAPSAAGTAVLLLATWWTCVLVTHRRLDRRVLVALLGVSQLVLHGALTLASTAGACVTVVHQHGDHLMQGATTTCASGSAAMAGMTGMEHHGPNGAAMVLAHGVAAVLLALVLARGEAAIWFLAALVWPTPPTAVRLPEALRPLQVATAVARVFTAVAVPGDVGRRGPPRVGAPAFS